MLRGLKDTAVEPFAYEEISITGSITTLNPLYLSKAEQVLIRFESGPIRYCVDGSVPNSNFGWPAYNGDEEVFSHYEAINMQMIRIGATNGLARVRYYAYKVVT